MRTATGEGIFTALQAIATVGAVMGGREGPPPARIVLDSDGAENVPLDHNGPRGAFTAARSAKDEGVQISTIPFGTPYGTVVYEGATIPVRVDDQTLQKIWIREREGGPQRLCLPYRGTECAESLERCQRRACQ